MSPGHPFGDMTIVAGDKTWTLRFGFDAQMEIEAEQPDPWLEWVKSYLPMLAVIDIPTDKSADERKLIAEQIERDAGPQILKMRARDLMELIRLALIEHHPDETKEGVRAILKSAGQIGAAKLLVAAVMAALFGEAGPEGQEDPQAGTATGNRQQRRAAAKTG